MPNDTHIRAALRMGYTLADAERAAAWVEQRKPRDMDAGDWVPDARAIGGGVFGVPLTRGMEHDALVAWFADETVPDRWKRLLSAGATNA